MKKLIQHFKKLSIGQKIWGVFLLLSALALLIILVCWIGEFIDDAIDRYMDEDIIPFLIRGLLIVAGVSFFFIKKNIAKWIFHISWILAVFLFAGLLIDNNDNFWRDLHHKKVEKYRRESGYYQEIYQQCSEYCKNNSCSNRKMRECESYNK